MFGTTRVEALVRMLPAYMPWICSLTWRFLLTWLENVRLLVDCASNSGALPYSRASGVSFTLTHSQQGSISASWATMNGLGRFVDRRGPVNHRPSCRAYFGLRVTSWNCVLASSAIVHSSDCHTHADLQLSSVASGFGEWHPARNQNMAFAESTSEH